MGIGIPDLPLGGTMTVPVIVSGHTTAFDVSNVTSRTIAVPTYSENDIIILAVTADMNSGTITAPGGGFSFVFQDVPIQTATPTQVSTCTVFWKIASASEGSTYTVDTSTSERAVMICFAVRGADTISTINATGTAENGDSITATVPAVTSTVNDCLRISVIGCDQSIDTTPHGACTDHTKLDDLFTTSGGAISVHYKTIATAGTDDAKTSTMAASQEWVGLSFAIAPDAGSGGGGGTGVLVTPVFGDTLFHMYDDLTDPSIPLNEPSDIFSDWWKYVGQGNRRMSVVDTPERITGYKSVEFSIDPAIDAAGVGGRSELLALADSSISTSLTNGSGVLKHITGGTYWYGLSIYIPSTTLADPTEPEVIFQCHSYTTNLNPPFSLRVDNDVWTLYVVYLNGSTRVKTLIPLETVTKDVWTDWAFNIFWSYQSNGWIKAYRNESLIHTHNGANNYNNGTTGHHMKMGVYKSAWNNTSTVETWHDRTYYHANMRIGGSDLTLADMSLIEVVADSFHLQEDLSDPGIPLDEPADIFSDNWSYVTEGNRRMAVVSSPERVTGNKSIEFNIDTAVDLATEVDRSQLIAQASTSLPGYLRNENDRLLHSNGGSYWYAFSVYIPTTTLTDEDTEGDGDKDESVFDIQSFTSGLNVILSLRVDVDNWFLLTSWSTLPGGPETTADINSVEIDLGSVDRGSWVDWAFRVDWSHQTTGVIKVYRDQSLILTRTGPNCYNLSSGFNVRTGIRKPAWKNWASADPTWHDRTYNIAEWKIGEGVLSLQDVSPPYEEPQIRQKLRHIGQGTRLGMRAGF